MGVSGRRGGPEKAESWISRVRGECWEDASGWEVSAEVPGGALGTRGHRGEPRFQRHKPRDLE